MPSERQFVDKQLADYGKVMYEVFKYQIALHRWHRSAQGRQLTEGEERMRMTTVQIVARIKQKLQPDDWARMKAFSQYLYTTADLGASEDRIISDFRPLEKLRN